MSHLGDLGEESWKGAASGGERARIHTRDPRWVSGAGRNTRDHLGKRSAELSHSLSGCRWKGSSLPGGGKRWGVGTQPKCPLRRAALDFLTVSENHLSSLSISFGGGREDHSGPLSNGERNVRTERCYAPVSRETKGRCADSGRRFVSGRDQALPFVDVFHA